jgi:hypothetical protein
MSNRLHRIRAGGLVISVLAVLLLTASAMADTTGEDYTGTLRIYIVEPTSRYTDGLGTPYHFGFLDFALETDLDIKDLGSYEQVVSFDPAALGFSGTSSGNMMAIAVIMNSDYVLRDAFPGFEYWFHAHFVDAVATTTPGLAGNSTPTTGFTHKVFVEQAGSGG